MRKITKKTKKVKKNVVISKKKKTTKKKVIKKKKTYKKITKKKVIKKKKIHRKITKKKVVKKKKTRNKRKKKRITRKKLSMIDIYPILNKVQMKKKPVSFVVEIIDAMTIENTIKDLNLTYNKKEMKKQVEFTVKPNKDDIFEEEDLLEVEYLDDEIPEIDQIFP